MDFWDFFWLLVFGFFFAAYLIVMFQIIIDLFRDQELSGWWKALWIVFMVFLPVMTALLYLIARGKGMAARQAGAMTRAKSDTDEYIRHVVAASSPADQIASAKNLLDAGAITPEEFSRIKAKALS